MGDVGGGHRPSLLGTICFGNCPSSRILLTRLTLDTVTRALLIAGDDIYEIILTNSNFIIHKDN